MGKIAFVFPGQGSQYLGMGKELFQNYPSAERVFAEADHILGRDLSGLCFNGPEELLKKTENCQLAILTTSIAALQVLKAEGIEPDFVAGHSLGEYSALVAAGALDFATTLSLVAKRAQLMAGADPEGKGGMAAVLGLDRDSLTTCLKHEALSRMVFAANFNSPGQIVISGEKKALLKAKDLVEANGGKFIDLPVSGAFHSQFMREAADLFQKELAAVNFQEQEVPLISNVTAHPVNSWQLSEELYRQLFSSVLWEDTINYLLTAGVDTFIEVGPGKVLSGLTKKISRQVNLYQTQDLNSIKKILEILNKV